MLDAPIKIGRVVIEFWVVSKFGTSGILMFEVTFGGVTFKLGLPNKFDP
jgi:hypothetical protein